MKLINRRTSLVLAFSVTFLGWVASVAAQSEAAAENAEPDQACIAVVLPSAQGVAGDAGEFSKSLRDLLVSYLTGPSLHSWDMGLFKNFRFTNEMNVQFRAEFFNIFNQVNFDIPGTTPGDNRIAANSANFGKITRTVPVTGDPRIIQFGLKFVF